MLNADGRDLCDKSFSEFTDGTLDIWAKIRFLGKGCERRSFGLRNGTATQQLAENMNFPFAFDSIYACACCHYLRSEAENRVKICQIQTNAHITFNKQTALRSRSVKGSANCLGLTLLANELCGGHIRIYAACVCVRAFPVEHSVKI